MNYCTHTNHHLALKSPADTPSWGNRLMAFLVAMSDLVFDAQRRAAERHHLASLSDHVLRDMGLSRADVERESSRRFWDK